jgi:maltose O-acetyltransferase
MMRVFYNKLMEAYNAVMKKKRERYIEGLVRNGLKLGQNVEIIDTFFFDPSHCFLISIGDHCTICPNVRLLAHDASTKNYLGYTKIGKIMIKEDCFIGDSVIVLPNVTIGPNAIVGAGSVVTRDIPPYTVAAGNPAKIIYTFDDYLEKIKTLKGNKRVFDENYLIHWLDKKKKQVVIDSVSDSIGFIV